MPESTERYGTEGGHTVRSTSRRVVPLLIACCLLLLGLGTLPARAGTEPCDCGTCHGDIHGPGWQGCSGCHESPPATGSHLVHYNSAPLTILRYGDTTVESTQDEYKFGCGNCHPLDRAKHRDGTVEVELYDPAAPLDSLKAKNPATAAYVPLPGSRTCSDVYCHSGYAVASSAVGEPLTYPANPIPPGYTLNRGYIMDPTCSNLTYPPYSVTTERVYATTPPWGGTNAAACEGCHAFPLTTYFPAVDRAVGDSHQWVDSWDWNYGHAWNMSWYSFGPVHCRTCHYGTVVDEGTSSYGGNPGDIVLFGPVPIASHVTHVNGNPDVAFDTVNGVAYRSSYSLAGATYDAGTRTCSNVPCHYDPVGTGRAGQRWQQEVSWGAPENLGGFGSAECDVCHRYGALSSTCAPAP